MTGSPPSERGTVNEISGAVGGRVVQARAISGDVHIHYADVSSSKVFPRQLPAAPRLFTGREDELAALDSLIDAWESNQALVIGTVTGPPGIGKTVLAVWWAHRVAERFPDGQLYVNLGGFSPGAPVEPAEAVRGFLNALDVPPERMPVSLEDQSALYRSLLVGRRVLVVLDNARSAEQVRPLLPGSPTCLVLVTSRDRLSGLLVVDGARSITMGPLRDADAVGWLTRYLGQSRVEAEPEAVRELVEQCGGLPLALAISASRVAMHPGLSLRDLTAELRDERDVLDALDTGDPMSSVRAVFSWSYSTLSPPAARLFRLLGLHLGRDFGLFAVMALAGTSRQRTRALLDELTRAHLLEQDRPNRYRFHELLRTYAMELAAEEDTEDDPEAAVRRVLCWHLRTADAAAGVLAPQRPRDALDLADDVEHVLSFQTYDQALQWCETERSYLVAAVRQAADHGMHDIAWRFPVALWDFFNLRKYWADWITTSEVGLESARWIGDRRGEAAVLHVLGNAYYDLRRLDDAIDYYHQALDIRREIGDRRSEGWTLNNLGTACQELRRFDDAIDCYRQALDIRREVGDRWGEGWTLNNLGEVHQNLRRFDEAIDYYRQALANRRDIGDRHGEGFTLDNLGLVYGALRRFDDAIGCYQRALGIRREIGDRWGEGWTLNNLGTAYRELRQFETAIDLYEQALDIRREIGDRWGEGWTLDGLGTALQHTHKVAAARARWQAARRILEDIEVFKEIGDTPRTPREVRVWCTTDEPIQVGESTHVAFAVVAPHGVLAASRGDSIDNLLPQPVRLRVLLHSDQATVRPVTQVTVLEVDRTSDPILFEVMPGRPGPVVLVFLVYLDRDSQLLQEVRVELPVVQTGEEMIAP